VAEFLPGFEATAWFAIAAPKQTPTEIIEWLNRQINATLDIPTMRARIAELDGEALPRSRTLKSGARSYELLE
jgi:tripartite-type tricarboxylate transporter receptor subunit TctC